MSFDTPEARTDLCGGFREIDLAHAATDRLQALLNTNTWDIQGHGIDGTGKQRREAHDLKEVVAEQTLDLGLLKKKHARGWGRARMRYPASERLEIIRRVEGGFVAQIV